MVEQADRPLTSAEELLFWDLFGINAGDEFRYEAVCSIHNTPTYEARVPTYGGYLIEIPGYKEAKVRLFPNSFNRVFNGSCFMTDDPRKVVRWVCDECRAEEELWLQEWREIL